MLEAPLPPDEAARLASLRASGLLDSPAETGFDELVELASTLCDMPMALVSLIDEDRQWFKASVGLDATETPRNVAFCAHAILESDRMFAVPDAHEDERFADNPLVTGGPLVRSYFGKPLVDASGSALGTLCVIDHVVRHLSTEQLRALEILGRQVEAQIELRRSRDRALVASRAKSRFLETMSHEIRTPLNGLLGTLELILDDPLEEQLRAELQTVLGAGRQLNGLLSSVLDISKSNAGQLQLQPGPTDIHELVQLVIATYAGGARRGGVEMTPVVDPDVPAHLYIDGIRLTQVLGNLLGNAVKFTTEGTIALRLGMDGTERIQFEVEDTGCGIAAADLERVYERFEQVGEVSGGTGLGLALARDLISLMGGELGVESEPGEGTRFHFSLPIFVSSVPQDPAVEVMEPLPAARILLVDDEPLNLQIGKHTLARLGLEAVTARGGEEAMRLATSEDFDAILLDCQMADLDGYEVARRLRRLVTMAHIPIIALTASEVDVVAERCQQAGMDDVLTKPINRETLSATLGRCLARHSR